MQSARLRHDPAEGFAAAGAGPTVRGAGCAAPPRRARLGVGSGEPQLPALAGEQGIRASPASPTAAPARHLSRQIRAQELALLRDAQTASHLRRK